MCVYLDCKLAKGTHVPYSGSLNLLVVTVFQKSIISHTEYGWVPPVIPTINKVLISPQLRQLWVVSIHKTRQSNFTKWHKEVCPDPRNQYGLKGHSESFCHGSMISLKSPTAAYEAAKIIHLRSTVVIPQSDEDWILRMVSAYVQTVIVHLQHFPKRDHSILTCPLVPPPFLFTFVDLYVIYPFKSN